MNQRTVDYVATTGDWIPGSTTAAILSTSDQTGLKKQFPKSPIIGDNPIGGVLMTRTSVAVGFKDTVMMGPVPGSQGYWGFDTEFKLDYMGPDPLHAPPEYGIVGDGGGDPLNSFMPNPMSTPNISEPASQPAGPDALKDMSDRMIELRPGSTFGQGMGTLLSPWTSTDTFTWTSPWRSSLVQDEHLGKYMMGWSGMTTLSAVHGDPSP